MNMHLQQNLREAFLDLAKPIHKSLRGRKVDLFLHLVGGNSAGEKLLDVGGGPGIDGEFLQLYANFRAVVVANPQEPRFAMPNGLPVQLITADGRNLPFESRSFDWVFSNAVIEHVGGWGDQIRFANEIRRMSAKGYFVTTPNKFFPIEPHTLLPFYQFLPVHIQRRIVPYSVGYLKQYEVVHLLTAMQMKKLFPEARVVSLGFPILGNSLVAFHRKVPRQNNFERRPSFSFLSARPLAFIERPSVKVAGAAKSHDETQLETRRSFEVLGVQVHAVQTQNVVARMEEWICDRSRCRSHTIAPTGMHGIVEAQHDPSFKEILNSADAVVPDGMPLVWLGRRRGHHLPRRVYGPDLMLEFCEKTVGCGYRHFFYGGEPGVPGRLAEALKRRFPEIQVCGTFSPPMRPLGPAEDKEVVSMISRAAPDVLWVGLGTPKQERWMHEHRDQLRVPVLVSVGAAFDILSGRRSQAPRWMRDHGLEWLFRLLQEPRRLWHRYLIYGAEFIAYLLVDWLHLKDFRSSWERESSIRSMPPANAVKDSGRMS
jgi:N-acetylglucosaminyldiphosphoundecaprenol N-acetyl-beta-D-mannosaminyltransferase